MPARVKWPVFYSELFRPGRPMTAEEIECWESYLDEKLAGWTGEELKDALGEIAERKAGRFNAPDMPEVARAMLARRRNGGNGADVPVVGCGLCTAGWLHTWYEWRDDWALADYMRAWNGPMVPCDCAAGRRVGGPCAVTVDAQAQERGFKEAGERWAGKADGAR